MIPEINLETFIKAVEEAAEQKEDNHKLTQLFQQAVHMYAVMQDLNTAGDLTVLANSLKNTAKLAESVLRDSSLGALQGQEKKTRDLVLNAKSCCLIAEILELEKEISSSPQNQSSHKRLIKRIEICFQEAMQIALLYEKRKLAIPIDHVLFFKKLEKMKTCLPMQKESSGFLEQVARFLEILHPPQNPTAIDSFSSLYTKKIHLDAKRPPQKETEAIGPLQGKIISYLLPVEVENLYRAEYPERSDPEILALINSGALISSMDFTLESLKSFMDRQGSYVHTLNLGHFAIDAELLDKCPHLRKVSFSGYSESEYPSVLNLLTEYPSVLNLLNHPSLRNITSLSLDKIPSRYYETVSFSQFTCLTSLSLRCSAISSEFFQRLVVQVPNLKKLNVSR